MVLRKCAEIVGIGREIILTDIKQIYTMQLYPLLFEPNLHSIVWGGNQLRPYKALEPSDEPIGESWEVSAVPTSTSMISNGVYAGKDLITVINENPDGILGTKVNEKYNGQLSCSRHLWGHSPR